MSQGIASYRIAICAGGWALSALLLCGCNFFPANPFQLVKPVPAAHDSPQKGLTPDKGPVSPAKNETAASTTTPVDARGLLLRGAWYRVPLIAEESVAGIYAGAVEKQPQSDTGVAGLHYRHAGLEQLMSAPPSWRADLPKLLTDGDRNVAVAAAIALARQGDARSAAPLIAAIEDEDLPLPARSAAAEALGLLPGGGHTTELRRLIGRYGQFAPGASTGYQADLHAELLRALARHVDAGDDPRFLAAAQVPSTLVRIETLRAWAAGSRGSMPADVADLRNDDDPRVRAAALTALGRAKTSAGPRLPCGGAARPGPRCPPCGHPRPGTTRRCAGPHDPRRLAQGPGRLDSRPGRGGDCRPRIAGRGARRGRRHVVAGAARRWRRPWPSTPTAMERVPRGASWMTPAPTLSGRWFDRWPPGRGKWPARCFSKRWARTPSRSASWPPNSLPRVGPRAAASPTMGRPREGLRPSPRCKPSTRSPFRQSVSLRQGEPFRQVAHLWQVVMALDSPLPTNLRSVPGEGQGERAVSSPLPPGEGQGVRAWKLLTSRQPLQDPVPSTQYPVRSTQYPVRPPAQGLCNGLRDPIPSARPLMVLRL